MPSLSVLFDLLSRDRNFSKVSSRQSSSPTTSISRRSTLPSSLPFSVWSQSNWDVFIGFHWYVANSRFACQCQRIVAGGRWHSDPPDVRSPVWSSLIKLVLLCGSTLSNIYLHIWSIHQSQLPNYQLCCCLMNIIISVVEASINELVSSMYVNSSLYQHWDV